MREDKSEGKTHRVPVNRDETVNEGKGSKYKTTTEAETTGAPEKTSTALPVTTNPPTTVIPVTEAPKAKTTHSSVPLDDVTTTQKTLATTNKPAEAKPAKEGHALAWILGKVLTSTLFSDLPTKIFLKNIFSNIVCERNLVRRMIVAKEFQFLRNSIKGKSSPSILACTSYMKHSRTPKIA